MAALQNLSNGILLRDYFSAKALPSAYEFWMRKYYHPSASDTEWRLDSGYRKDPEPELIAEFA